MVPCRKTWQRKWKKPRVRRSISMKGGEGEEGDGRCNLEHFVPPVHDHEERRPPPILEQRLPPTGSLELLTVRERQVVACLAAGHSTKEVAFALGIADATVRVLLARAAGKLGVHSRGELLRHPAVQPLRSAPPAPPPEG